MAAPGTWARIQGWSLATGAYECHGGSGGGGAWRADLQGAFAGKALVSEPGTPACPSWSAEWLYLAGRWGEGKYVGSMPSPPAHSAPAANPSQRL